MGYSQPKVKLRLCEHLRIYAPHVFTKQPPNVQESLHNFPNKFPPQLQPQFPGGPPFPHSQMIPPESDQLAHSHKPEHLDKPMDNMMYSRNNLVWQGNLARNGKKQVGSVAVSISGQCTTFLNHALEVINITHRLKWEEASKNLPLAVFSLHPAPNAKLESFLEYIDYFQSKNRIGVAPLGNEHNLYVCAPGNPLYDKHLPEGVSTPTLIGIAVSLESPTNNQPGRLQQSNGDWLNQLSTITAMLGTKK